MLKNNKMSRVILALLMTLNINIFSPSITNAKPVEDSYYNPYTHGVEVENKTFGANGESNSDRQAREKREAEAKKQAEAQKAQNQARKTDADKIKDFEAEFGDQYYKPKDASTTVSDNSEEKRDNVDKQKVDSGNDVFSKESLEKFKNLAETKCKEMANKLQKDNKSLRLDNGQVVADEKDICSEASIEAIADCFATFSHDGNGNYLEPSSEILDLCVEKLYATKANTVDSGDIIDQLQNSLANFVVEKTGLEWAGDIIRDITWQDVVEEVAIWGALTAATALTGGLAGGAVLARLALLASKAGKVVKIASKGNKLAKAEKGFSLAKDTLQNAKEGIKFNKWISKKYDKVNDKFIKEAERVTGKKFDNIDEARDFIKNATKDNNPSWANLEKNEKLKKLQDIEGKMTKFENDKFAELEGKSIKEIKDMKEVGQKDILKQQEKIERLEKQIQNNYKVKKAQKDLKKAKEELNVMKKIQEESYQEATRLEKEIPSLEAKEIGKELRKLNTNKVSRNVLVTSSSLDVAGHIAKGTIWDSPKEKAEQRRQEHFENNKEAYTEQANVKRVIVEHEKIKQDYIKATDPSLNEYRSKVQTAEQELRKAELTDKIGKIHAEKASQYNNALDKLDSVASQNTDYQKSKALETKFNNDIDIYNQKASINNAKQYSITNSEQAQAHATALQNNSADIKSQVNK